MLIEILTGCEDSGQFKQEGVVLGFLIDFMDGVGRIRMEPRTVVSGDVGILKVNITQKGMLDDIWLWLQRVNIATLVVISYREA